MLSDNFLLVASNDPSQPQQGKIYQLSSEPEQTGMLPWLPLIYRTCWNYNLCGYVRIYKDQIFVIDPYEDQ